MSQCFVLKKALVKLDVQKAQLSYLKGPEGVNTDINPTLPVRSLPTFLAVNQATKSVVIILKGSIVAIKRVEVKRKKVKSFT